MTKLLQQAFSQAQELPEDVQDEIAAALIETTEEKFDELIERHPGALAWLVAEAREDIRAGRVAPLTEADFAVEAD